MLKIFFVINIIIADNGLEVGLKNGSKLHLSTQNIEYKYYYDLLMFAKEHNKPVAIEFDSSSSILKAVSCKLFTVSGITEQEKAYRISALPYAGVYYADKSNKQLCTLLQTSKKEEKPIWVAIQLNKILMAEPK